MSEPLDPELSALESALTRLEPQGQVSRDVVLFEAGKASAGKRWFWPACTGASTLLAAALGWLLLQTPDIEPERVVRYIVVEKPVTQLVEVVVPVSPERTRPNEGEIADYFKRRRAFLRFGADALPESPPTTMGDDPLTPASVPRFDPDSSDDRKPRRESPLPSGVDS